MAYADASIPSVGPETSGRIGETDWDDPASVARCANAIWKGRGTPAKMRAEAQAYRNIAWVAGDQWSIWNPRDRRMVADDRDITGQFERPDWEQRLTYNHMLPIVEMKTAKLERNRPAWDVLPVTEDDDDVAKAKTSKQVMDGHWDSLGMPALMAEAIPDALTTKIVFFDVFWDANAGIDKQVLTTDFLAHPDAPQDLTADPMQWAEQMMEQSYGPEAARAGVWKGKTGGVRVELAPIFEVNVWPFNCTKLKQQPTIWMRSYQRTAEEIADELNLDVDYVRSLNGKSRGNDGEFYRDRPQRSQWQADTDGVSADEDNDGILCHKIMRVPCKKYPKGRLAYVIGKECVSLDDNPYRGGKPTLVPLAEKYIPSHAWGRCTSDDLIDAQKDINRAASQESNHGNFALMPTLITYQGSLMEEDDFNNSPGGTAKCLSPALKPEFLQRPQIGPEYSNRIQRNLQLLHEISGVGEVDTGSMDPGGKSGRFVLAQQEQNDLKMIPFGERLDIAIQEVGERVLEMLQDFASDEMVLQLVGENNKVESVKFKGTDLQPSNYGQPGARTAMVKVQSFSQMPSTRAETRMLLDSFVTNGVLDPKMREEDRAMLLELYGVGDNQKLVDRNRKHHAKQTSEIDTWKRGQSAPMPTQTDKHTIHRLCLENWMNTQSYQDVIALNPMLGQEIAAHLDMHRQGEADDLVRPIYQQRLADMRMWAEFQAKAMAINPQLAQAVFPAPLGAMAMMQPGPQNGGGEKAGPPQHGGPSEADHGGPPQNA